MTKLTLSVEEEVVEQAKRLAKEEGTSVSAVFAQVIQAWAARRAKQRPIGPLTRAATGLAKIPEQMTYREAIEEALLDHYGLNK